MKNERKILSGGGDRREGFFEQKRGRKRPSFAFKTKLSFDRGGGRGKLAREMPSPAIESLLILQDRDAKRLGLEALLKAVPRDVALVEGKIAAEKAAIETAKQELKELEVKKKALENDIGGNIYRLSVPAKSYFGRAEGEKMPLQAFGKFLSGHGIPITGIVTEARFDTAEAVPVLKFRAVRR